MFQKDVNMDVGPEEVKAFAKCILQQVKDDWSLDLLVEMNDNATDGDPVKVILKRYEGKTGEFTVIAEIAGTLQCCE